MPRRFLLPLVGALGAVAACAQILGYDGLNPRNDVDAGADGVADTLADGSATDSVTDSIVAEAETGPTPLVPPGRPAGLPAKPSGKGKSLYLATRKYHLGSLNVGGITDKTAWRTIGWDIDGRCTTAEDSKLNRNTCTRNPAAPADVLTDGDGCRDNNFGSQIVPQILAFKPNFETSANDGLEHGGATLLLVIDDLDDGPDDGYAPGKLLHIDKLSSPKWDGTDVRDVSYDSVVGGDINKPKVTFPKGYVSGNLWVSGERADTVITLNSNGLSLELPVLLGVLTLPLDAAHTASGNTLTLSAGLATAGLGALLGPLASQLGLCPGSDGYKALLNQFIDLADLVSGAPNLQDPTKPCDTLSLGLGLDQFPIAPPTTVGPPATPPPDKCADAGPG